MMTAHVSHTVSECDYQLCHMKAARRLLSLESAQSLVRTFVISRLDYCKGVLAGIDQCQADRLQSVLKAAARILFGGTRRDHITHITLLIRDKLHWLRFNQLVTFKLCIMVYK